MYLLVGLLALVYAFIYYYYKSRFAYWSRKKIPQLEPSIPLGDLEVPWKKIPTNVQFANAYRKFKERGEKHGVMFVFSNPIYIPVDPEIIKNIIIKDFQHFSARGIYYSEEEPIFENLLFLDGPRWKTLRQKLSSTFTSGKMKTMFEIMLSHTQPLIKYVEEKCVEDEVIDIKETLARFTTDVIGSCAFGIECNSFETPNSEFRKYGRKVTEENVFKSIKLLFAYSFGNLGRKLGIKIIDEQAADFFVKIAMDTYNYRKDNKVRRNDFMQLLIDLKEEEDALTMRELVSQVFIFFMAGYDTSSATLTFTLFELAANLDVQNRLRREINEVLKKHDGKITYEALQDMKYMDQVISEALRKYPVVSMIARVCTRQYKVPNINTTINKGVSVIVSALGLHRDAELFPDPEKFDPDRFSDNNKAKIVPGSYLPFGDGPRICIGLRFGVMQVKIGLVTLLKDFEFRVNSKTTVPLKLDFGFITTVRGGVWLNSNRI